MQKLTFALHQRLDGDVAYRITPSNTDPTGPLMRDPVLVMWKLYFQRNIRYAFMMERLSYKHLALRSSGDQIRIQPIRLAS